MKKQIVLNEDDIRKTIANSFNVDKDSVTFTFYERTINYQPKDHFKVTVEVPMNDQR